MYLESEKVESSRYVIGEIPEELEIMGFGVKSCSLLFLDGHCWSSSLSFELKQALLLL